MINLPPLPPRPPLHPMEPGGQPFILLSEEAWEERRRLRASQFVLIRNNSPQLNERWRCDPRKGGCGGTHDYYTLKCVERPWSGVIEAFVAYVKLGMGDPEKRQRIKANLDWIEQRHPLTAHSWGANELDEEVLGFALGTFVEITPQEARRYVDIINGRGLRPPLKLRGVNDGPVQVSPSSPIVAPYGGRSILRPR